MEITFFDILSSLGRGVLETLRVLPLCIILSFLIGTVLGIVQSRKIFIVKYIINIFIITMRGIPPLLFMMFFFFALDIEAPFVAAVIVLSVYHAAYITEIVRGGIESIPKGQFEAAESLGLSEVIIMIKVIVPQTWYRIVPSLIGQYIILVKDTALMSAIGVRELLYSGKQLMQLTFKPFQIFFLVGAIFYVICFSLQQLSIWAEKTLKKKALDSGR